MVDGEFDYVIVGAGSAGSVLANRLSADPATRVLLIEAGPTDAHSLIHMPKGFGRLLADPGHVWFFPVGAGETWVRGKVLGGSSSVNGMVYMRGPDWAWDSWAEAGIAGWDAAAMRAAYAGIEERDGPQHDD